ncbi:MAG: M23 family metallopeptidase, partial [Prolixibacteraceae bacterium]
MKIYWLFFFFIFTLTGFSQTGYYSDPVKIPLNLSGSFAELRSNHFHSGIDIKTNRITGIPVNSVADGFISRIVVSPTGFGRALYIDHPNGTTSVYAHLESFREDIEEYIKDEQYKRQSFKIDIPVPRNRFKVVKDEIIAYSGNSGSSGGPHLHFEIRHTESQEPLNPLKYQFTVKDNTAPKIFSLMAVPLSEHAHVNYSAKNEKFSVVFYNGRFHLHGNPVIPLFGKVGFAVQANDYFDNSLNKCGIYSLKLKIDGELYYSFTMDRFAFHETRYLNSHINYEEYKTSGRRYIKTWLDPGNKLRIYDYTRENGIYNFDDGNIHHIRIELTDIHGNASILQFKVDSKFGNLPVPEKKSTALFEYDKPNRFREDKIHLEIPRGALYQNAPFNYTVQPGDAKFYSDIHWIHNDKTPLHQNADIKIKADNLPVKLQSKALLVNVNPNTGNFYAAGGEYSNGWVRSSIREFGNYAVAVDTVAPVIIPLSIRNSSELIESNRIRFKVSDNLAGIEKIEGYLN